eukprot:COSAG04_NODE_13077_length_621_cov_0.852490_1_plen_65_part_00
MKAAVAVARKAEAEERERLKRQEKKERAAWKKAEEKAELAAKALAVSLFPPGRICRLSGLFGFG